MKHIYSHEYYLCNSPTRTETWVEYGYFCLTQHLWHSSEAARRSGLNHLNAVGNGGERWRGLCVCVWVTAGKRETITPAPHSHSVLSGMTELCERLPSAPQAELCCRSALCTRHTHTHTHALPVTWKHSAASSATSSFVSLHLCHSHREKVWRLMQCR